MSSPETIRSDSALPPLMRRTWLWVLLLILGLGAWAVALPADPARAWRSVLINFIYFVPLAAGLSLWPGIVILSNGRWSTRLAPVALSGVGYWPVSLLALGALWLGVRHWAPWAAASGRPQGFWLDPSFVFPRDLGMLVLFWLLAGWFVRRRRAGPGKVAAAWAIVSFCATMTLLAFDLVMALDPLWYSTLFGGYFFMSALYASVAAWTLIVVWRMCDEQAVRDLGNLILAFSILTTYMMFSQLLPIWYENLPHEVRFVTPRVYFGPWPAISVVLLAMVYLGPLALLIWRRIKWRRRPLGWVALYVLVGLWIERWWLVTPTAGGAMTVGLAEVGMALAFGSALVMSLAFTRRTLPAELPQEPGA